jgi:hypothetical protein
MRLIMNKTLLAAAVAGLSMVAASSAYALGSNPNAPITSSATTGSSLVFSVLDITANTSYSQILEVAGTNKSSSLPLDTFLTSNSFATLTLGSTNWTSFSTTVTWGTDQVVYEVQAASNGIANPSFGFATTVSTQADNATSIPANNAEVLTALEAQFKAPGDVQGLASKVDSYLGFVKGGLGAKTTSGNDAAAISAATNSWNASQLGSNVGGTLPTGEDAQILVGQSAAFFFDNASSAKVLGSWNFTGQTGVLSYTPAVAAVPVPAAAWMMLSGLVGLLSFRRNKA